MSSQQGLSPFVLHQASSSLQVHDDNCFSESLCLVGAEKSFSIAAAPANLGPAVIKVS